jgi:hypothetical protein
MVAIGSRTNGIIGWQQQRQRERLGQRRSGGGYQTLNGQEGCIPTAGTLVGGGANPSVRIVLTLARYHQLVALSGPAGNLTSANLYFLGATTVTGGAG